MRAGREWSHADTSHFDGTDRIPLTCYLRLGKCGSVSILELLEWVEAGCPRRTEWLTISGSSG
jgi:hypothetical protein